MAHKKLVAFILLVCLFAMLFSACSKHPYDEEWILGKTSAEIEAKYGSFDRQGNYRQEDGKFYSCRVGYIIKESRVSFFGRTTEELFIIHFNAEGIAYSCEIGPGNWGG